MSTSTGVLHRRGVMRLATAADEILPLRDPRVQQNPAYLTVIVLARVITRLGALPDIDTARRSRVCSPPISTICSGSTSSINAVEETDRRRQAPRRPGRRAAPRCGAHAPWGKHEGLSARRRLYEEMAFIARHFHWSRDELMALEHRGAPALVPGDLGINRALDGAPAQPIRRLRQRIMAQTRPVPRLSLSGRVRRLQNGGFSRVKGLCAR